MSEVGEVRCGEEVEGVGQLGSVVVPGCPGFGEGLERFALFESCDAYVAAFAFL